MLLMMKNKQRLFKKVANQADVNAKADPASNTDYNVSTEVFSLLDGEL